jgi:rubrerythrin
MGTMVGTETTLIGFVNNLIELDFNTIEAYKGAIERVDDVNARRKFASFIEDHQRHIDDLTAFLRDMKHEPAEQGDLKRALAKGKVMIRGLLGAQSLLEALKSIELDTNRAYERAIERAEIPDRLRVLLKKSLVDEQRHLSWILQQLNEGETSSASEDKRLG